MTEPGAPVEKMQIDPVVVPNGAFAEPRPLVDVVRLPVPDAPGGED